MRKWQPTPVFLPGKSHGQRSLLGYTPWGCRVRYDWIHTRYHIIPRYSNGRSEEELKSFLTRVKEESEKAGLNSVFKKTKIMVSSPINPWQIEGEKVETVTDFIFLGSKITADSDCSHKIRRCLLLGRKAMTNLENVLKSRDITLPAKVHIVKAMVFSVVMYGCES